MERKSGDFHSYIHLNMFTVLRQIEITFSRGARIKLLGDMDRCIDTVDTTYEMVESGILLPRRTETFNR